ncbi:MAG: ABC transporter permease [Candidatus Sumerlaeia bacterium]|nr:ABC transporter permease [Candidatus Sumerlaeia bacterium]
MRLSGYIFLLVREFRRNKGRTISLIISIMIATFFIILAVGLRKGITFEVLPQLERAFPAKVLLVKPGVTSIAGIQLTTEKITPELIAKINKIPGVTFVSPQMTLAFPSRAISRIFGTEFSTDVVVIGIEKHIIADYLAQGKDFIYSPHQPVPALISQYFLNLYNLGISESLSLPKFEPNSVIGRKFQLVLGESTLGELLSTQKSQTIECELVGLTPDISLIGLVLPLAAVEHFNNWFWGKRLHTYSALRVGVDSLAHIEPVTTELQRLNLSVSTNLDELNRIRSNINLILLLVFLLVTSIMILTGLHLLTLSASLVREQQTEIALLQVLGLTPEEFVLFISLHRAVTALIAGLVGSALALLFSQVINQTIFNALQNLPFVPRHLFLIPFNWIFLMTLCLIMVNISITLIFYAPGLRRHTR